MIEQLKVIAFAAMVAITAPEFVQSNVGIVETRYEAEQTEADIQAEMVEILENREPTFDELLEVAMGEQNITEADIELMALVTMAEAENQPVEGQRLVIDTFLNRKDHPAFPDTIYDVIWQPGQYVCMFNGRTNRCYVKEELVQLVKEELVSRTNYDVIYFSADGYSNYGTPVIFIGNHGFTSY
jgi:N-acetylmuramoyl-L-alanine amidase